MPSQDNETVRMKIFPKGQVVIPIRLRKKYHIEVGDQIDIVESSEGILLRLAHKERTISPMSEYLFGIFARYAKTKKKLTNKQIREATETGFTEGWE